MNVLQVVGPGLKAMLIQQFVPEDSDVLGSSLYFNSYSSRSARTISLDSISFDEVCPLSLSLSTHSGLKMLPSSSDQLGTAGFCTFELRCCSFPFLFAKLRVALHISVLESQSQLVPADEEVTSDPSGPELPHLLRDTARPNTTPRAPGVSQLLASVNFLFDFG